MASTLYESVRRTYEGIDMIIGLDSLCVEDGRSQNNHIEHQRYFSRFLIMSKTDGEAWSPYFESFTEFELRKGFHTLIVIKKPKYSGKQTDQLFRWLISGMPQGSC